MIRPHQFVMLFILLLTGFSAAAKEPVKVACIGNSVTYGYGLSKPGVQSYPALLQQKLGNDYRVENFGHSGATLLRRGHNPYYKTKAFAGALQFRPDIALIHLGLNDTDPRNFPHYRDEFIPDYNWLIDTLKKANPQVKIFVCRLTPIFTGHPRFISSTFDWYHEVQKSITQVAVINKAAVIDFYKALHNRPDLFTDALTLHPNAAGTEKIAEIVYKHITGNFGGFRLPGIFADHMVLQRDKPLVFWGTANANTTVTVAFGKLQKSINAANDGTWQFTFPPMKATSEPQTISFTNNGQQVVLKNILVGDVWLASGQSNMYFSLAQTKGGDSLAWASSKKTIRLLKYRPYAETDNKAWDSTALKKANELDFFSGTWKTNETPAVKEFSGVAYAFAEKIHSEIGVPVGVIELAVGGSPQISWVSRLALESDARFVNAFKNWRNSDFLMQWCRERANTNLAQATSAFQRHTYEPSYNFEAGISNIVPFAMKGVIWYQGESDAENAELYKKLFPMFVQDWRSQWKDDFPFYYVQLSGINRPSWNYFRDVQRQLLQTVPNSGMAVSSDLGHETDVHPADKIPVGHRLAQLALHHTYHKKIVPAGPLISRAMLQGSHVVIVFENSKGLRTLNNEPLRGFQLVNDKGDFIKAAAAMKDDKIFIQVPNGQSINKVVYGWEPFTQANLVNAALLPASTFMLDL